MHIVYYYYYYLKKKKHKILWFESLTLRCGKEWWDREIDNGPDGDDDHVALWWSVLLF